MDTNKILISTGCSFTMVPNTYMNWPFFLEQRTNTTAFFDGGGCFGNDAISKRTIYRTSDCLKTHKPEDILVGVMWSGVSRKTLYSATQKSEIPKFHHGEHIDEPYEYANPNCIIKDGPKCLYSLHPYFTDSISKMYFKFFHDDVGALVESLEHVLRVQWFLKLNKIKYFFTEYAMDSISGEPYKQFYDHPDVKHLIEQIDYDNFLPVENMLYWIKNVSLLKYSNPNDDHPTSEMSEAFVDRVIMPHLKSKGHV